MLKRGKMFEIRVDPLLIRWGEEQEIFLRDMQGGTRKNTNFKE